MTMKNKSITMLVAAVLVTGCQTDPKVEMATRIENLGSFVTELEAKAKDPNATISWPEADARFDQLYQPALKISDDSALAGLRMSQDYLAGRYAALRVRHATVDELRAWLTTKSEQWQGFIEGLGGP